MFCSLLICFTAVYYAHAADAGQKSWGYSPTDDKGPSKWRDDYPVCGSKSNQSPVNFDTLTVEEDPRMGEILFIDYDEFPPNRTWTILNNGHTIVLSANYTWPPQIQAGSLHAKYELWQIHFHWGHEDFRGSEHHLDGRQYPLEMHIVHKRRNINAAEMRADPIGLSVVAVFFDLSHANNEHLAPITDALKLVETPQISKKVVLPEFTLKSLLPHIPDYFRYNGSLTTPPCDTIVQWSVMRQPIGVSTNQLKAFRSLLAYAPTDNNSIPIYIMENFRPVQDMAGRKVLFYYSNGAIPQRNGGHGGILAIFCLIFLGSIKI